jgi:Na+/glutamate symporter
MTMLVAVSALLFGLALGQRHTVFVLIPASVIAGLAAACMSFAAHDEPFAVLMPTIFTVAALQIGYLAAVVFISNFQNAASAHHAPALKL